MTSATLIKTARRRAGLTQTALGARLGKSQSEIGRWERGETKPSFETLQGIVRACGLQLSTSLAASDDSYVPDIDQMLSLSPRERVARAAQHALAMRRLRDAAGLVERG
jgi:transcriptional regulator with XRE-family HTH domain